MDYQISYSVGTYIYPYCHQTINAESNHNCPALAGVPADPTGAQVVVSSTLEERQVNALERIARALESLEKNL